MERFSLRPRGPRTPRAGDRRGFPSAASSNAASPSFTGGKFFAPTFSSDAVGPAGRRSLRRRGSHANLHSPSHRLRLVRRDAPFFQSSGRIYMHRNHHLLDRLALADPFHVGLSMPIWLLVMLCLVVYTLVMLVFSGLYILLDNPSVHCGIAPEGVWPSFYQAFAFSMETMTTIGYGIPHGGSFFDEGCVGVLIAVYFEAMIFIMLNAALVGVLFSRISVANKRSSQIIFSDKAAIRCVRNRFYFMFQVRRRAAPPGLAQRTHTRAAACNRLAPRLHTRSRAPLARTRFENRLRAPPTRAPHPCAPTRAPPTRATGACGRWERLPSSDTTRSSRRT